MNLPEKIRNMRMDQRLSQKDLADKLECSPALLNQIEKGQKPVTLDMAFRIEIALNHVGREISSVVIQTIYAEAGGQPVAQKAEEVSPEIQSTNKLVDRRERIMGEVISVPVKLPKDIYLKLEWE